MERSQLLDLIGIIFGSRSRHTFGSGSGMIFEIPVGGGARISITRIALMGTKHWSFPEQQGYPNLTASHDHGLLGYSKLLLALSRTDYGKDLISHTIANNEHLRQTYILLIEWWKVIINQIQSLDISMKEEHAQPYNLKGDKLPPITVMTVANKNDNLKSQVVDENFISSLDELVLRLISENRISHDPTEIGTITYPSGKQVVTDKIFGNTYVETHKVLSTQDNLTILKYIYDLTIRAWETDYNFGKLHKDTLSLLTKPYAPDGCQWSDSPSTEVVQNYPRNTPDNDARIEKILDLARKILNNQNHIEIPLPSISAFEEAASKGYLSSQDANGKYRVIKPLQVLFIDNPCLCDLKQPIHVEYLLKQDGKPFSPDYIKVALNKAKDSKSH